jgi:hypothetical protein
MSESVDVPPRSTHKTSQVELRCFFPIGSYSYLSIQSRALSNGGGGLYFRLPVKKEGSLYRTTNPPVIIRKLYFFIIIIRGWGRQQHKRKNKRSEGEKTVSQESFIFLLHVVYK